MMRSDRAPRSVIAPISVEKRVTKSRRFVDEVVDAEAISVGRTLIERRTRRYACVIVDRIRLAHDVHVMCKVVQPGEYTPAYRREPEEFCFPTMTTSAWPSKIGRIRKDAIPHCLRSAARRASSKVCRIP